MSSREEIDALVEKYSRGDGFDPVYHFDHQYDDRSADINYAMVRHVKPKVVVEFGTRYGRCTQNILQALLKNGEPFTFKPYELEKDMRFIAQRDIDKAFGKLVTIGGDITKATDIPDNIEYLFVDNNHDRITTEWVFSTLLKKCKPGALIHFHDLSLQGNFEIVRTRLPEADVMLAMHDAGTLPLKKIYWTFEEGDRWESTWWEYEPS